MYQGIIEESKIAVMFKFVAENKTAIETKLIEQFQKDGYQKRVQSDTVITFERGSYVARIFLGAFYKYFKWDVKIREDDGFYRVILIRQASGMSGGLIGVNQVKNELLRLKGVISNWN